MANPQEADFWVQADALMRKNLIFQKRNKRTNMCLISLPILLCLLQLGMTAMQSSASSGKENAPKYKCSAKDPFQGSSSGNSISKLCPEKQPQLLPIPSSPYRAVRTDFIPFKDLPDPSLKKEASCPTTMLYTGTNQSFGESLSDELFKITQNGTGSENNIPAISYDRKSYLLQKEKCESNEKQDKTEASCLQCLFLRRDSAATLNDELFKGYKRGNRKGEINEIATAFNFLNSNINKFNVSVWYNTSERQSDVQDVLLKLPPVQPSAEASMDLISRAYLQLLQRPGADMQFEFVKEMPQLNSIDSQGSVMDKPDFLVWVFLLLFPVVLQGLVYEKQLKLRLMMKMHGLGDGAYWLITYGYFLIVSLIYMLIFAIAGSLCGMKIFIMNSFSIQFVFCFLYLNLQISIAFLFAAFLSDVKTATGIGYITVFAASLLGQNFFAGFVQDPLFPKSWSIFLEIFPGFALFRGLYELAEYGQAWNLFRGFNGMQWGNLSDPENGMKEVLVIMLVEWVVILWCAYHIDINGDGCPISSFFKSQKTPKELAMHELPGEKSGAVAPIEMSDVGQETEKVKKLISGGDKSHALVVNDLKKVYPGRDGDPPKFAVKGLSLALPRAECFGMLGPNGAGKTSFISMMIGLTRPSLGTAYVDNLDIRTDMRKVHLCMGVCPQFDLLWDTLTGREHLLFYGRLKNLKEEALNKAVEDSLKGVDLFKGGVPDKRVGGYSGGMKRRLSVAIALIGDPKVVYMDEPSTGLDPASRNSLWNVVKKAKKDRAIVLTTHSMEEAETLCDRIGIFVDGGLQCVGYPQELKARYGGSYVFTMTTSADHETEVESLVRVLSPSARRVYHLSGTQKFELPKDEVKITDVFREVEKAKKSFTIFAWGLADTSLEDVFIKVAREAQERNKSS